jgi:hypothetical protein
MEVRGKRRRRHGRKDNGIRGMEERAREKKTWKKGKGEKKVWKKGQGKKRHGRKGNGRRGMEIRGKRRRRHGKKDNGRRGIEEREREKEDMEERLREEEA